MTLVDLPLARRLESADAAAALACVEAIQRLRPELGAVAIKAGGGIVAFAGAGSPLSHALGAGLDGPLSSEDLDRIEAVFFERNAPSVFECCPLADPSVMTLLGERGYRPTEFADVLFREVGAEDHPGPPPGVVVRRALPEEAETWADVLTEGFSNGFPNVPEDLRDIARTLFGMSLSTPYLATFEGEPAGAGTLIVSEGVGTLAGTAVRPAFRNRGIHTAVQLARLRDAGAAGCDLATMGALPGSGSHRNAERLGLRVAYTRVQFTRDPA